MSTGPGWRTRHASTSCLTGSEGAGLAAGSERVRLVETPAPTIGGGGWGTPHLGPFEASPWGLKGVCQVVQRATPLRGERGKGV